MATKLKNVKLTSVDFVKAGANQDADIKFFKSADGGPNMKEEAMRRSFFDMVKNFFSQNSEDVKSLEKSRIAKAKEMIESESELYTSVLKKSLDSIIFNDELDSDDKMKLMKTSLAEFNETMDEALNNWSQLDKSITDEIIKKAYASRNGGGAEMAYRVNKNLLTAAEQEQLEKLLAKSKCKKAEDLDEPDDVADDDDEVIVTEEEFKKLPDDEGNDVNKSFAGEVAELRKTVAELHKASEMKEMKDIAKKYAPLGRKEDELAETLYNMKKSSKSAYDEYVALLDESMDLVEKSGIFTEIGKSGANYGFGGGSAATKIESIASDIQKSDASLSRVAAVAKAWEQHPELVAQYEKEYRG